MRGKYHTKHSWSCLIGASLLLLLCIIVSFCIKCGWKIALITVGAAVSLILNSPIDNVNRELGWEDQKNETNICKMTKKGQKMSFHARRVEIMANIGIMVLSLKGTEKLNP